MARMVRIVALAILFTCARAEWNPVYSVEASEDVRQLRGEIEALVERLDRLERDRGQDIVDLRSRIVDALSNRGSGSEAPSDRFDEADPDPPLSAGNGQMGIGLDGNELLVDSLKSLENDVTELQEKLSEVEQQERDWKKKLDEHLDTLETRVEEMEKAVSELNTDLDALNTTLHKPRNRRFVRDVSRPSKTRSDPSPTDVVEALDRLENMMTSLMNRVTLLEEGSSLARASKYKEEFPRLREEAEAAKTINS